MLWLSSKRYLNVDIFRATYSEIYLFRLFWYFDQCKWKRCISGNTCHCVWSVAKRSISQVGIEPLTQCQHLTLQASLVIGLYTTNVRLAFLIKLKDQGSFLLGNKRSNQKFVKVSFLIILTPLFLHVLHKWILNFCKENI